MVVPPGLTGASRVSPELFCISHRSTPLCGKGPPRLEIDERDGVYVLVDDGPRDQWRYVFVAHTPS